MSPWAINFRFFVWINHHVFDVLYRQILRQKLPPSLKFWRDRSARHVMFDGLGSRSENGGGKGRRLGIKKEELRRKRELGMRKEGEINCGMRIADCPARSSFAMPTVLQRCRRAQRCGRGGMQEWDERGNQMPAIARCTVKRSMRRSGREPAGA